MGGADGVDFVFAVIAVLADEVFELPFYAGDVAMRMLVLCFSVYIGICMSGVVSLRMNHGARRLLGVAFRGIGIDLVGVDINSPSGAEDIRDALGQLILLSLPAIAD